MTASYLVELYEEDEIFNLWFNKFMNAEIESKVFEIGGSPIISVVK